MTGFWEMSACTNISISQLLIDMREINVTTRTRIEGLLGLVYNLLSERVRFLEMTTVRPGVFGGGSGTSLGFFSR